MFIFSNVQLARFPVELLFSVGGQTLEVLESSQSSLISMMMLPCCLIIALIWNSSLLPLSPCHKLMQVHHNLAQDDAFLILIRGGNHRMDTVSSYLSN
jgi:hypothetical protein